jgi:hypothetical protein
VERGNDEPTEMQLKFQESPNPSVVITASNVGGIGHNLTAANRAVTTQKLWEFNAQCQSFAQVVQLGQNGVPYAWLPNTGHTGYDNRPIDLHQLSGVAQLRVLHGLMSQPNIMTSMIYQIMRCHPDNM